MVSVAVIGASKDKARFSNKAIRAYLSHGYEVYPVNPKETQVEGLACYPAITAIPDAIDIALFYVNPAIGMTLVEQVAKKGVKTIYLNPGAESPELAKKAEGLGLSVIQACSILAIGEDPDKL